jgi:lipid A 3-O-deacylase
MSAILRQDRNLKRCCARALACLCALAAGSASAGAPPPQPQAAPPQNGAAPARPLPPASSYPIEGPYGPYSDLVPNTGQMSVANSPFANLPTRAAPYPSSPYGGYPAYVPPPPYPVAPYPAVPVYTPPYAGAPYPAAPVYTPPYPAVPAYTPAYTPQPPPPPAYSQYPAPAPAPVPQYSPPAAKAPPRQIAAEPDGEETGNPLFGLITEVKAGILYHDAGVFGRGEERGADADGEIRFLPWEWLDFMASPRPHLGFHINSAGDTSQVFTGLTWEWNFLPPFFADASFGLAVHDGAITTDALGTKELGSRVLFRESVEIGWNFYGPHSVSILVDHVSHGTMLGPKNEGMDSLGLRYGYRF